MDEQSTMPGSSIHDATERIRRNGGRVDVKEKKVTMPEMPGISMWGAHDCLVNHHKFTSIKSHR